LYYRGIYVGIRDRGAYLYAWGYYVQGRAGNTGKGGVMKDKIIELIKKYQAESERNWTPATGYVDGYARGYSIAFGRCADDLEELLKSDKEGDETK